MTHNTASRRLSIATKIHFAIKRELGEGVSIERMLSERAYAAEVLHVCRGLGSDNLHTLAKRFDAETAAESARFHLAQASISARRALAQITHRAPEHAHTAGDEAESQGWSADSSAFQITGPLALDGPVRMAAQVTPGWWSSIGRAARR